MKIDTKRLHFSKTWAEMVVTEPGMTTLFNLGQSLK